MEVEESIIFDDSRRRKSTTVSTTESSETAGESERATTTEATSSEEEVKQVASTIEQILYIQMEFCEKNTLRQAIDSGELIGQSRRAWRLFRSGFFAPGPSYNQQSPSFFFVTPTPSSVGLRTQRAVRDVGGRGAYRTGLKAGRRCTPEGTPFQQSTPIKAAFAASLPWDSRALPRDARRDNPFRPERESNPLGRLY